MTRDKLLSLKHTTSVVNKYLTITADLGYKITTWTPNVDIKDFYYFTTASMPIAETYPNYRVITEEEAMQYQAEKNKLIERDLWK
jgi:hypothetical protein